MSRRQIRLVEETFGRCVQKFVSVVVTTRDHNARRNVYSYHRTLVLFYQRFSQHKSIY
jgi:hypothetical protein